MQNMDYKYLKGTQPAARDLPGIRAMNCRKAAGKFPPKDAALKNGAEFLPVFRCPNPVRPRIPLPLGSGILFLYHKIVTGAGGFYI